MVYRFVNFIPIHCSLVLAIAYTSCISNYGVLKNLIHNLQKEKHMPEPIVPITYIQTPMDNFAGENEHYIPPSPWTRKCLFQTVTFCSRLHIHYLHNLILLHFQHLFLFPFQFLILLLQFQNFSFQFHGISLLTSP